MPCQASEHITFCLDFSFYYTMYVVYKVQTQAKVKVTCFMSHPCKKKIEKKDHKSTYLYIFNKVKIGNSILYNWFSECCNQKVSN